MRFLLSALSAVLLVLVVLLTPLSAVAVWTRAELGNEDRYVSAMAPLAHDDEVQDAVTDLITDAVVEQGGTLTSAFEGLIRTGVRAFVESGAFPPVWEEANRQAHESFNRTLTEEGAPVTIDLAPVVERAKQWLTDNGIPLADQLPAIRAEFTLAPSGELDTARDTFRELEEAAVWLPPVTLVCAVGAVLAAPRRRLGLLLAGLAVAVGGLLLRVWVGATRPAYLDRLPEELPRSAGGAVYDALTETLRTASWVIAGCGLVVAVLALVALLARPRRTA
ncbi:hypothetical protein [Streptomyces sp. GC420]|uniref:hypothetical protein n=1 Tax=Streptomyces sp. GC420 TaxID=2697568 RepID=UPI001414E7A7|nr:hypothetical protein [Streptomyces sp. GC420]NBM19867.1 hypothetical protein [Streptomyces sp. GC420]